MLEYVILSLHIDRRVSPVRWVHKLINLSVPPHLKEPLLLNVNDDDRLSVTKVLFVMKIHCHLVQMTFVLSVKERCPQCVCTQTSGGELRRSSGRSLPSGVGDISRSRLWVTLSASGMAVAPSLFPSLPTVSIQLYTCLGVCAEAHAAVVSTSVSLRGSGSMLKGPEQAGSALHVRTTSAVL